MKFSACPHCSEKPLGDQWGQGRMLKQYCRECGWHGEYRVPEQLEIETTRQVSVNRFFGYEYVTYDKFGHGMVYSRTYSTFAEAEEAVKQELDRGSRDKVAGPYKVVLWPASVEVKGTVYLPPENGNG